METKYFDLHVFIRRNEGYSFGVKMLVPKGTNVQEDDVIAYAEKINLFTEVGDGSMVDTVDEITMEEFKEIYG